MKPTVTKKISQILALFMLVSMLVPALAFAADGFKNVSFDGKAVSGSVYGTTYYQNGVSVYVYGPNDTYVTAVQATYDSTASISGQVYSYKFPSPSQVTTDVYSFITLKAPDVTTAVYQAVYDLTPPVWTNGNLSTSALAQTSLTLNWSGADSTAASYNLYNGATLIASNVTGTTYDVTGLTASTSYTFKVQAVDSLGNASTDGPSLTVTTSANQTQNQTAPVWTSGTLTATNVSQDSLTLNWSGADSTADSYNVYNGIALIASNVTATTYSVTGLTASTSYTFTVQAVNNQGIASTDGPSTTVKTADATNQSPAAPVWTSKTLTATNISQDSLTLNWSAADSTTTVSYNVYKGGSLYGSTVTGLTYNVTGLSDDTSYTFMIQAVNIAGSADGPTLTVSTEKKSSSSSTPAGGGSGGTTSTGNTVSADASGKVDATALSNAFANSTEVSISVTGDSAQLPASALVDAAKKDGASVTVTSSEGSYTLPLSVLNGLGEIAKTLGVNASDLTIKVTISKVSGDTATGLNSAAKSGGINLLADAVDFNVQAVTTDGKTASIDYGNTYVSRTLNLNATVDTNNATGVLYDPATGTFSFVPSTFSGNTATLKRNGNSIYTVASFNKSFTDIGNHWAKADIQLLANKLVIDGMTDSTFAPESNITRGQFAALVVRALGLTTSAASSSTFKDVKSSDWYANAVNAAAQAGLVNGYEDGTFRADKQITREELAALIVRALNYAGVATDISSSQQAQLLAKYSDSDKIVWGQKEIAAAIHAGIINGLTDTTIGSDSNATRAQSATMLKRLLTEAGFIN